MTDDLSRLWLATVQQLVGRAAHEVKDALNGVSVNLEVVRSRASASGTTMAGVAPFASAAAGQLETLGARVEALLYLCRPARDPADVALTLRHLAALLVPAARAAGGALRVEGADGSVPTTAGGQSTRLALAAVLLTMTEKGGSGRCRLTPGPETVVRFSHESAGVLSLDPAIASAIASAVGTAGIRTERSDHDLILVFPGHPAPPNGSTL